MVFCILAQCKKGVLLLDLRCLSGDKKDELKSVTLEEEPKWICGIVQWEVLRGGVALKGNSFRLLHLERWHHRLAFA
jgi:hypothetical protein